MKKLIFLFFVALITILNIPANAQEKNNLVGNWKSSIVLSLKSMNAWERSAYDSLPGQNKERFIRNFSERTFSFEDNGAVTISFIVNNTPQKAPGQWSYSSSGNILTINIQGEKHLYRVEWVSSKEIILHYQQVSRQAILKSLYLIRQ